MILFIKTRLFWYQYCFVNLSPISKINGHISLISDLHPRVNVSIHLLWGHIYVYHPLYSMRHKRKILSSSGGSREGSGGSLEARSMPPLLNILWKWNNLVSLRLFHFHGIFKKNEIYQQSEPRLFLTYEPPFQKSWIRPCRGLQCWLNKRLILSFYNNIHGNHYTIHKGAVREIWVLII